MLIISESRGDMAPGVFIIQVSRPGKPTTDITYYREVPVRIDSYTYGDPFGDSTARLVFPQITPYDDLDSSDLWFLREWTNVAIYWVPGKATQTNAGDYQMIDPQSGKKSMWTDLAAKQLLWEGFTVSLNPTDEGLSVDCQGALFELDRYLAKPVYPDRPWANEAIMAQYFADPSWRPDVTPVLRVKPLKIEWPTGWAKTADWTEVDRYTPRGITKGANWTGYSTRSTGTWDRVLTGYMMDLLSTMYTDEKCGVTPGLQWTLQKDTGRQPVLRVRDRYRDPDFQLYHGTPGMEVSLTRDGMSTANVVYGMGKGFDGSTWSNAQVSNDGTLTWHDPIAWDHSKWPKDTNPQVMISETLINFGTGVALDEGITAGGKMAMRDREAGWVGSVTLQTDPTTSLSRWQLRAGMSFRLLGFMGKREGIHLHISEVTCSPEQGTVSLKVDTNFRDLLTLEEVTAKVRDPLTPVRMLQVNRRSGLIEDVGAPWDYDAGSGYVPLKSKEMFAKKPEAEVFPWKQMLTKYPPRSYPDLYVRINASDPWSKNRWTKNIPILTAAAGTIRKSVFVAVDYWGNVLEIPFHVSIYYLYEPSIPHTGNNYSPFADNHFESVSDTGLPFPPGNFFQPDPSMIIGWGNKAQRAGYSPGRSSDGSPPSGMLIDESPWTWDMAGQNNDYDPQYGGSNPRPASRQLYGCFYAEHSATMWILGRLYRAEPGAG